jgi:hypothetical protein
MQAPRLVGNYDAYGALVYVLSGGSAGKSASTVTSELPLTQVVVRDISDTTYPGSVVMIGDADPRNTDNALQILGSPTDINELPDLFASNAEGQPGWTLETIGPFPIATPISKSYDVASNFSNVASQTSVISVTPTRVGAGANDIQGLITSAVVTTKPSRGTQLTRAGLAGLVNNNESYRSSTVLDPHTLVVSGNNTVNFISGASVDAPGSVFVSSKSIQYGNNETTQKMVDHSGIDGSVPDYYSGPVDISVEVQVNLPSDNTIDQAVVCRADINVYWAAVDPNTGSLRVFSGFYPVQTSATPLPLANPFTITATGNSRFVNPTNFGGDQGYASYLIGYTANIVATNINTGQQVPFNNAFLSVVARYPSQSPTGNGPAAITVIDGDYNGPIDITRTTTYYALPTAERARDYNTSMSRPAPTYVVDAVRTAIHAVFHSAQGIAFVGHNEFDKYLTTITTPSVLLKLLAVASVGEDNLTRNISVVNVDPRLSPADHLALTDSGMDPIRQGGAIEMAYQGGDKKYKSGIFDAISGFLGPIGGIAKGIQGAVCSPVADSIINAVSGMGSSRYSSCSCNDQVGSSRYAGSSYTPDTSSIAAASGRYHSAGFPEDSEEPLSDLAEADLRLSEPLSCETEEPDPADVFMNDPLCYLLNEGDPGYPYFCPPSREEITFFDPVRKPCYRSAGYASPNGFDPRDNSDDPVLIQPILPSRPKLIRNTTQVSSSNKRKDLTEEPIDQAWPGRPIMYNLKGEPIKFKSITDMKSDSRRHAKYRSTAADSTGSPDYQAVPCSGGDIPKAEYTKSRAMSRFHSAAAGTTSSTPQTTKAYTDLVNVSGLTTSGKLKSSSEDVGELLKNIFTFSQEPEDDDEGDEDYGDEEVTEVFEVETKSPEQFREAVATAMPDALQEGDQNFDIKQPSQEEYYESMKGVYAGHYPNLISTGAGPGISADHNKRLAALNAPTLRPIFPSMQQFPLVTDENKVFVASLVVSQLPLVRGTHGVGTSSAEVAESLAASYKQPIVVSNKVIAHFDVSFDDSAVQEAITAITAAATRYPSNYKNTLYISASIGEVVIAPGDITGDSFTLALYLCCLGLPVGPTVTGAVGPKGELKRIGDISAKVTAFRTFFKETRVSPLVYPSHSMSERSYSSVRELGDARQLASVGAYSKASQTGVVPISTLGDALAYFTCGGYPAWFAKNYDKQEVKVVNRYRTGSLAARSVVHLLMKAMRLRESYEVASGKAEKLAVKKSMGELGNMISQQWPVFTTWSHNESEQQGSSNAGVQDAIAKATTLAKANTMKVNTGVDNGSWYFVQKDGGLTKTYSTTKGSKSQKDKNASGRLKGKMDVFTLTQSSGETREISVFIPEIKKSAPVKTSKNARLEKSKQFLDDPSSIANLFKM